MKTEKVKQNVSYDIKHTFLKYRDGEGNLNPNLPPNLRT